MQPHRHCSLRPAPEDKPKPLRRLVSVPARSSWREFQPPRERGAAGLAPAVPRQSALCALSAAGKPRALSCALRSEAPWRLWKVPASSTEVEASLPWTRGRARNSEERSHGLLDPAKPYPTPAVPPFLSSPAGPCVRQEPRVPGPWLHRNLSPAGCALRSALSARPGQLPCGAASGFRECRRQPPRKPPARRPEPANANAAALELRVVRWQAQAPPREWVCARPPAEPLHA